MANTVIALKKSATPSAAPSNLANGELAINYADGKLYYKHANGSIVAFNTSGGVSFGTVNANGTLVVADAASGILNLVPGNNIQITADPINDIITISATATGGTGDAGPAFDKANLANQIASLAYDKANAANLLAYNTGIGANAYAATVGTGANNYLLAVIAGANTAVGAGANAFASATVSGANTIAIAAFAKANTGGANVSDTAPVSPANGSFWWNSSVGSLFIYYNDGTSGQWVEAFPSNLYANNTVATTASINAGLAYDKANSANYFAFLINANTTAAFAKANSALPNATGTLAGTLTTTGPIYDSKGDVRDIPINNQIVPYAITGSDTGKTVSTNTTIFVPNAVFNAGNTVTVFNNSAVAITITQNSSVTMYLSGTGNTGNRTLSQRGLATLLCYAANTFVITGTGLT